MQQNRQAAPMTLAPPSRTFQFSLDAVHTQSVQLARTQTGPMSSRPRRSLPSTARLTRTASVEHDECPCQKKKIKTASEK